MRVRKCRVQSFAFWVWRFGSRILGSKARVRGFGFQVRPDTSKAGRKGYHYACLRCSCAALLKGTIGFHVGSMLA